MLLNYLLRCFIFIIGGLFVIIPPVSIQYLLYLPAKRIFKKIPPHVLYAVCLLLNTIALIALHCNVSNDIPDDADLHPLDIIGMGIFDFVLDCIWLLCYIGVVISCVTKTIKSKRKNNGNQ